MKQKRGSFAHFSTLHMTISRSQDVPKKTFGDRWISGASEEIMVFSRLIFLGLVALIAPMRSVAQSATPKGPQTKEATAVVQAVRTLLAAASTDDLPKFHSLIAPGFYAFDTGKRLDGDSLMQMVMSAHTKGMKFVWNLTDPDVHVQKDTAWIAYTNVGSIQASVSAEPTPMTWLESAYLERHHGLWQIVFFQSSRVSPSPPNDQH
jgi:hypothetical protein